ncbi:MAG TPA: hypothetical protein VNR64_02855 [Vicinamibacterales bacterium]|nr:hypothetical protein [Vicinamibacterales bacterium]
MTSGIALHLLKDARLSNATITRPSSDEAERGSGIRCPRCRWRPSASSRWCCSAAEAPEPFFSGCGTVWNTFATKGRCPGCQHQWQWTSCLRCAEWSPHVDWYETGERQ